MMIAKRHLITAMLGTFCLTTLLFIVVPTRSQTEPEYDPWKDVNDDGKIDILDITSLTSTYGAIGDPTKNVNITNFPLDMDGNLKVKTQEGTERHVESVSYDLLEIYPINGYNSKFPFIFNPKGSNQNVTMVWVYCYAHIELGGTVYGAANVLINDLGAINIPGDPWYGIFDLIYSEPSNSTAVLNSIRPYEINFLRFEVPFGNFALRKLSLLIQYEYLA